MQTERHVAFPGAPASAFPQGVCNGFDVFSRSSRERQRLQNMLFASRCVDCVAAGTAWRQGEKKEVGIKSHLAKKEAAADVVVVADALTAGA